MRAPRRPGGRAAGGSGRGSRGAQTAVKYALRRAPHMKRPARHRRKGGRGVGGPDSGLGGGGSGTAVEAMPTMSLTEVAENILESFQKLDKETPSAGIGEPEGTMIGGEVFSYPFVFNGRNRRISMHRTLLKTSPDFQLGCVYGMLVQRLRPKMFLCKHCGKVKEPTYGFGSGMIVDLPEEKRRDRCD